MKDIHSGLSAVIAIGDAVLAADNVPPAVDLRGYDAAELLLTIGVGGITFTGTNKIEFVLTHSDDDVTYVPVVTADMLGVVVTGAGIIKSLVTAQAAPTVSRFGYKGGRRYTKLLADFSGTHGTGTAMAATWLRGFGHDNPQVNQT